MSKHPKIDELFYELDLHDLPVNKLEILFEHRTAIFEFFEWDELRNEYQPLVLRFNIVERFILNNPNNVDLFQLKELFSAEINQVDDNRHKVQIVFLIGFGEQDCMIEFTFESLEIKRGQPA